MAKGKYALHIVFRRPQDIGFAGMAFISLSVLGAYASLRRVPRTLDLNTCWNVGQSSFMDGGMRELFSNI